MLDTESFRIFLEFHDLPVDHIFFLLAIQREILGSEDQTQKKKHDGFVIPFMESCREKLASFGLAGDWVICKTMQNRLLLAFFRYLVIIMQKFVHQSIWYHSSLCFKYILVSSSFSSCSSKWTKKTKKKHWVQSFLLGQILTYPPFCQRWHTWTNLTTNRFPTTRPNLTVGSRRLPLSGCPWHLLALQPWLNHLWRGYLEVENVAGRRFPFFEPPPFPGAMVWWFLVFCCWGFSGPVLWKERPMEVRCWMKVFWSFEAEVVFFCSAGTGGAISGR